MLTIAQRSKGSLCHGFFLSGEGRYILIDLPVGSISLIVFHLLLTDSLTHMATELFDTFRPSSSVDSPFVVPFLVNTAFGGDPLEGDPELVLSNNPYQLSNQLTE